MTTRRNFLKSSAATPLLALPVVGESRVIDVEKEAEALEYLKANTICSDYTGGSYTGERTTVIHFPKQKTKFTEAEIKSLAREIERECEELTIRYSDE